MDINTSDISGQGAREPEKVEIPDDDIDITEINQIDEILRKSEAENVKMLDFERQMFLDCVYNDGLVICGKGISYDKVLLNIFKVYVDPENLVLVLNSSDYEENFYTKLMDSPHVHQASTNANEREKVYLAGGIQFISTQVLVVDLLKNRVPAELITGILVLRAHQIIESCQEAFALRLYRQKNKTGFIKAFTKSAEAFTYGYGHVEKVMRNLFVRDLFLWPRFHALILNNLKAFEPISIEFHIPMTYKMTQIQTHLLDLMNFMVKDLKRINPHVDLEEVTVENCVTKRFQKILQSQLDVIWNQLNAKTKLLIADLKVLRNLMFTTIYGDSISLFASLKRYRTAEYALSNSGWTLLAAAESIFKLAKERVFNDKDEFDPEPCPKWKSLSEILKVEIPEDIKRMIKDKQCEFDKDKPIRVLILCNDGLTCYQLNQYLTQGLERTLFWQAMRNDVSIQKLSDNYKTVYSGGSGIVKDAVEVKKIKLHPDKPATSAVLQKTEKVPLVMSMLKSRKRTVDGEPSKESAKDSEKDLSSVADQTEEEECFKDSFYLTMTQTSNDDESLASGSALNFEFETMADFTDTLNATIELSKMQKPTVCIQTFRSDENKASSLDQALLEMQPNYIIMYNTNITAIRQIEVFEARLQRHPKQRLKVYVLMHAKTVEEQSFLTNLRREKKAFELLIETKRTMIIPEYQDGKSEINDCTKALEEEEVSSRQAGGQVDAAKKKEPPRVIVDSREFRSELPCLIHRRGIEIVPLMITVGDYILTPEICVERKSISDLIGSLNSGRLYNQCQQMTRFYTKPILLIEFDQNKPFHLQGRYMLSRDSESNNVEIMQKLQLLTIHFPKLRLVWSPSPYATAQLFEEIKLNKTEPDPKEAIQSGLDDPSLELDAITDKYNAAIHDFVMKLPGVTLKNINAIMRKGKNLKELLKMDEIQLIELLGNSKDAKAFWGSLHNQHKPKQEEPKGSKFKKTYKKF